MANSHWTKDGTEHSPCSQDLLFDILEAHPDWWQAWKAGKATKNSANSRLQVSQVIKEELKRLRAPTAKSGPAINSRASISSLLAVTDSPDHAPLPALHYSEADGPRTHRRRLAMHDLLPCKQA